MGPDVHQAVKAVEALYTHSLLPVEEYENCFWQNTEINQCIWEEAAPATSLHCAQLYSLSSLIQRRVQNSLEELVEDGML